MNVKSFFKKYSKKDIAVLLIVLVILVFDAFMVYKLVYYTNLSESDESSMNISGQTSFDQVPYQDELNLTDEEAVFDLETE